MARRRGGLVRVVGGIAALTALARVAGFGRTAVLAGVAGRTCVADAYLTANQLPNVVFEVVAGGALAAAVLPLVAAAGSSDGRIRQPGGAAAAGSAAGDDLAVRTLSALLGWVLVTLVPAAVSCAALAPQLARALTGTGCAGESTLVARMIVIFAAQIPLYGLSVLAAGTLQAAHRFTAAAAAPLVSTLVVTAGYLVFALLLPGDGVPPPGLLSRAAVLAIAGGTTAGVLVLAATVVVAALRLPALRRPADRARLHPTLRFPPGRAVLAVRLAGAGLATVLAAQGAAVVFTVVANRAGVAGSLASYSYAAAVYLLPAAVLTMPVTTSVLPRITVLDPLAAAGPPPSGANPTAATGTAAGTRLVVGSSTVVVLLGLAGAAVLVAVAPAVGRLFDAGPGGRAGAGVGAALGWLALGVPGAALTTHLTRVASALRRPAAAGVLGAGGWVLAAAAAVLAGHLAAPVQVAQALGAAMAAGMLAGGVLALAAWSRIPGLPTLRPLVAPAAVGLGAAVVGGLLGRGAGQVLLPAATGGDAVLPRVLLAGAAAGVTALVVTAALVASGVRLTGLHRRLQLPGLGGGLR